MSAFGIVDRDPYDPASAPFDDRNLALPIGFNFPSSCKAAHRNLCLSSAVARLHLRCISSALPLPPARWRSCSKPSFSRRRRERWPRCGHDRAVSLFTARSHEQALEWEAELEAAGLPCAVIQTWEAWMRDPDARAARIFAEVGGEVQLGRAAWVKSAGIDLG